MPREGPQVCANPIRWHGFFAAAILSLAAAILSLTVALAACQTDSVSLDEAKRITASLAQSGFVPPPRSVKDIVDRVYLPPEAVKDQRACRTRRKRSSPSPSP